MAPHSSTLAWKIPWTEEPGRLQSMRSLRVGHNSATSLSLFTFMHWRRKWQPTPVFLPGESQGQEAWWAAVCGAAQSRTGLKRLSSSSIIISKKKKKCAYFELKKTLLLKSASHLPCFQQAVIFFLLLEDLKYGENYQHTLGKKH